LKDRAEAALLASAPLDHGGGPAPLMMIVPPAAWGTNRQEIFVDAHESGPRPGIPRPARAGRYLTFRPSAGRIDQRSNESWFSGGVHPSGCVDRSMKEVGPPIAPPPGNKLDQIVLADRVGAPTVANAEHFGPSGHDGGGPG